LHAKMSKIILIALSFIFLTLRADALSFSEALHAAKKHPDAKIADLTLEQSQKQTHKSYLNLTPSVNLYTSQIASPSPRDFSETTWGIGTTLNLFSGLRDFHSIRQERANYRAAAALRQTEMLEREITVGQIYLECLFYQTSESSALESHNVGNQISEVARKRFERGLTSKDEYLKLRVDAETSQVKYISEKSKKENCYSNLKYWVGSFSNLDNISLKEAPSLRTLSEFPINHPKFTYYKDIVGREKFYSRVLLAKNLPQVNLEYSREYQPTVVDPISFWALRGTWTLFDSGQSWMNTQIQNIELEKASEKLKTVEKTILRDSETLERTYLDNLKLYKILESNLSQIKSTFRTSLNRYRAGATTANDVALDQSRVIVATYSLDDMWLQKHLSLIRYQNSLGKSITELLR